MKKTLREYFIKSHSNDPQIEKDIKLNSTLKLISYLMFYLNFNSHYFSKNQLIIMLYLV